MIEPRAIYSRSKKTPGKLIGWQARWYGPDGIQDQENGFPTKRAAKDYARDMESDRDNGRYNRSPKRAQAAAAAVATVPTVAGYVWRTEERRMIIKRKMRDSTKQSQRYAIRNRIERSIIGPMPMDGSVKARDVNDWLAELVERGITADAVRTSLAVLRRVLDAAVEDDDLPGVVSNPARSASIIIPDVDKEARPVELPTLAHLHALGDRMPRRYRAMIYVQAGLGLRIGELCGLREQDVDMLRREVHITGQALAGFAYKRGETKSRRPRTLIMQRLVQLVLAEHMQRYPRGMDGMIFSSGRGSSARDCYSLAFRAAADACAEEDPTFPRHLVTHHLRHMEGSVFVDAGGSRAAAARRLGHATTELLTTTYEHEVPGQDESTRKMLDAAWGGEAEATRAATGENVDSSWIPKRGNRT